MNDGNEEQENDEGEGEESYLLEEQENALINDPEVKNKRKINID